MFEISLLMTALLLGFYGSVHCFGMCGPIVAVLGLNTEYKRIPAAFLYNFGRITTFILLGILAAFLALALQDLKPIQLALRYFSAIVMLMVALQLLGLPHFLGFIERPGQIIWRPLSQFGKRFLPIKTAFSAYMAGIIWGFLPCGMVYMAFALSIGSSNFFTAPLVMLLFGIGTLPMMLSLSLFGNYFGQLLQHRNARRVSGVLIIGMIIFYLLTTGGGGMSMDMDNMDMNKDSSGMMDHAMPMAHPTPMEQQNGTMSH